MSADWRYTFDANMLVYAVDKDAGKRHTLAADLLRSAAERNSNCVLTVQVLAEFYTVTTRKGLLTATIAGSYVREWSEVFPVFSVDMQSLFKAIEVVQKHKISFWDGCYGLRRIGPDAPSSSPRTCRT